MSNAFNTPTMAALRQRLAAPMPNQERTKPMPTPAFDPRKPERLPDRDRPRRPFADHLRELVLPDGRRILVDRRAIAFIIEAKPGEAGGKATSVIAFRSMVKGVPVTTPYEVLKPWWLGIGGAVQQQR
jgi:hypothetical protein